MWNKKLAMKQITHLLSLLLLTIPLVSCSDLTGTDTAARSDEGEQMKQGKESPYTRSGIQQNGKLEFHVLQSQYKRGEILSYELTNLSGHPISYGAGLHFEKKVGKRWFEVYFENESVIDIAYGLDSGKSEVKTYARSGDLPSGEYRLIKEVWIIEATGQESDQWVLISDPFIITETTPPDQKDSSESAMSALPALSLKDRIERTKGVSLGEKSNLVLPEQQISKIDLTGSEVVKYGLSEKEYIVGDAVCFRMTNQTDMNLHYGEFTGIEIDIDGTWTEVHVDFSYNSPLHRLEPDEQVELGAPVTQKLPTGTYRLTKEVEFVHTTDREDKKQIVLISDPFIMLEK
ncbi:immunoglobulin-like domain-containing protein [Paenibacillus sp. Marseille-Q4541]|uniref:immunoglobulin-like domain-containing protein n=1 Tax=Paenibacillus sp. Marseille-Q4541 TaxID=2831522 RepID=UPI001BADFFAD|nr:immunoglobulin-like domain-containing protein [Paenibacillus sp. Marseille-Q4541]